MRSWLQRRVRALLGRRRWLPRALVLGLGAGVVVAGPGWLLWYGPSWANRAVWDQLGPADRATTTGQFRTAVIQLAGATGAVVALT
jgi:hypothetical protein